jgi:hypothetical protein
MSDFQIDGLPNNGNNNNNNNGGNGAFNGIPNDILTQLGAANNNNANNNNGNGNADFGDLGLGNLGGNSPAPANNGQDFNFGGSNNNMNFDLNLPAASDMHQQKIRKPEVNLKALARQKLRKLVEADSKLLKQAEQAVLKKQAKLK